MLFAEKEILSSINNICLEHLQAVACRGVSLGAPKIKVWKEGEFYTSEISVLVTKNGEFEDLLEFFVFRDGKIQVEAGEVTNWMKDQIKEILQRHSPSDGDEN